MAIGSLGTVQRPTLTFSPCQKSGPIKIILSRKASCSVFALDESTV